MDEPPLNQSGKKTMDFHFSCHTPSTFREELMDFTLFYYFFIFVLDGPGMSRPFGIWHKCKANAGNLSPRRQTNMRNFC